MKRNIRISSVQLSTVLPGRSFAEKQRNTLREIRTFLHKAGEVSSDLVLFGEYANLHHRTWSTNRREYIPDPIPGRVTAAVGVLARKYTMQVAFPMFGTWQGVLSSYVVLFGRDGSIIGCYQKSHPTEHEQELGIRPGADIPVYQLDSVRIGIMTCMDIEYPEVAQVLMLRGADVLLFPHVQASWGEVDWEIRYRARAIDTGLPLVSACFGYPEGEWLPGKMIGRTSVVGRDGLVMRDLGRRVGMLTYDLDLTERRKTLFFFNIMHNRTDAVIASRRPELYHVLVDPRPKEEARARLGVRQKGVRHA